jgi:L-arabinokinase
MTETMDARVTTREVREAAGAPGAEGEEVGRIPEGAVRAVRAAGEGWLTPGRRATIAAAPGRLDVMGGIADYSGAVVLEGTIGELATVEVQRREDDVLRVRTAGSEAGRLERSEFALRVGDFYADGALQPYAAVRDLFPLEARWAAYLLGVFYVLLAEGELPALPGGANVALHSAVPLGAGVASSAAIEVATMRAVAAAYGAPTAGLRLAALCQVVENRVVGAPCGIMDQVTCAMGQAGTLLVLRCQPHDVLGGAAPPAGYAFTGLDSGVKHAVGGTRYTRVRCAAFMGRRIIGAALAAAGEDAAGVRYLCDVTPAAYRARWRDLLPARLGGREFLERWGDHGDAATAVDPAESYPVRGATEHAIYENGRVQRFRDLLRRAAATRRPEDERRAMVAAGRLMYGSHRSYGRSCGLGAAETDLLVSRMRGEGAATGLFGAKITGGGSGGTVAVLRAAGGVLGERAEQALGRVADAYGARTGRRPRVISGSQPGAEWMTPLEVEW